MHDGESALESALLMPPEMLITDVVLPEMTNPS
jgi:YesN/AraC family two-component response regulator